MSAVTADLLDHWTITGARRWLASLAVVVALHIAVALIILFRQVPMAPANPPQPPILMDLAPLPAESIINNQISPAPPQNQASPTIPQVQPQTQPQLQTQTQSQVQPQTQSQVQPQSQPVLPPIPPVPQPETTSPQLPSSAEQAEPRIIVPPPPEVAEPPPAPAKPVANKTPVQTASAASLPILPMPDAQETPLSAWQRKVIARLILFKKRLPLNVPINEAAAEADVQISVDHNGHIVYFTITRSSGYPTIDHAIRSLIRHADPLPPPPPGPIDILNAPLTFTITIGYYDVPLN